MIAASRFDNRHVILPTRYLACVDYYAMLAAYPSATIETGNRFDKRRKETHRTVIADIVRAERREDVLCRKKIC